MNDNYNSSRPKDAANNWYTKKTGSMQPSKRALQNILNYARSIQHIRINDMDIKLNLN